MENQEKKPFSAKRWTEDPGLRRVEGGMIRHFTEEEKRENELQFEEILRAYGQLKPNEYIRDGKVYTKE